LPLVAAVAVSAPLFTDDPGAADRGIAYISVYLVTMSPCLWAVAYPYLSGHSLRELDLRKVFSPPFLAAIAGLVLAGIPPLQRLFVGEGAVFGVVLDAADLVGTGVIPCALLVLGANLWDTAAGGAQRLPVRAVAGVCAARFVLLPGVATLLVLGLRRAGIIPADPMFAFVLLLEATVPPANNLVVMTQLNRRGEGGMAMLLFWGYLLAVPFLGAWVILYLWLLRT
jgi:predicted permease